MYVCLLQSTRTDGRGDIESSCMIYLRAILASCFSMIKVGESIFMACLFVVVSVSCRNQFEKELIERHSFFQSITKSVTGRVPFFSLKETLAHCTWHTTIHFSHSTVQ